MEIVVMQTCRRYVQSDFGCVLQIDSSRGRLPIYSALAENVSSDFQSETNSQGPVQLFTTIFSKIFY